MKDKGTALTVRLSTDERLRWQRAALQLNETSLGAFIRRVMTDYLDHPSPAFVPCWIEGCRNGVDVSGVHRGHAPICITCRKRLENWV